MFVYEVHNVEFHVGNSIMSFGIKVICYITSLFVFDRVEVFSHPVFDATFCLSNVFFIAAFAFYTVYHI